MTFEKTYDIQKDNRLVIKLPERFKSKKRVKVIIEDVDESRQEKIKLLKKASKDPLFLSDIDEITSVFEDSDHELLWNLRNGPITSRKPDRVVYPNEVLLLARKYGLENESIALCHQIRTIDKKRLSNNYGQITNQEVRHEIIEALCFQLGIQLPKST